MKTRTNQGEGHQGVLPGHAGLAVVVLAGIFLILLSTAVPAFKEISIKEFLTGKHWDPTSPEKAEYGILSMIVSTLLVTAGALADRRPGRTGRRRLPVRRRPWRVREIVKPVVEVLAAIPSVVVGFLGIVLFGPSRPDLSRRATG